MYPNLEGELRKNRITRQKLALDLNMSISTVSKKLTNPGRLKLSEAYKIRDMYFPEQSIEWLFSTTA